MSSFNLGESVSMRIGYHRLPDLQLYKMNFILVSTFLSLAPWNVIRGTINAYFFAVTLYFHL